MTLTLHCAPVVLPVAGEPIRDGAVLVDGDRVVAVGPRSAIGEGRERHWPGVLTPGLVNAHTHLQYTDYADLATAGMPFPVWIKTLTERRRTWTDAQWGESTRRGVHEVLRTGTTCVADVVSDGGVLPALARSGLAGVAYVEVVGVESERWPEAREELLARLHSAPRGIDVGVSPHALYTLGTEALRGSAAVAREMGMRLHPHVAETVHETEFVGAGTGPFAGPRFDGGTGRTPVAHAESLGLLGPDVHVAHGVHVTAGDREVLRRNGTAVALCVRSNATLGAGVPPVAGYLAEGNAVAVGTDSRASAPDLDLLAEVRALHGVAVAQGVPPEGLARTLVEAATAGGAKALGRNDSGAIAPGMRADLAVFDAPVDGDPYEALVAHGRCVATVLGGRLVHRAPL